MSGEVVFALILFAISLGLFRYNEKILNQAKDSLLDAIDREKDIKKHLERLTALQKQLDDKRFHRKLYEELIVKMEQQGRYEICVKLKNLLESTDELFILEPDFMRVTVEEDNETATINM